MSDVKKGPYKIVAKLRRGGAVESYSLCIEHKNGYLKEIAPDVGDGQTARMICNLMNRQYKEETDDAASETDG